MMPSLETMIRYVEGRTGVCRRGDEGVHFGGGQRAVKRLLLCWMPTPEALLEAAELGCDAVVGHETLWYPYDAAISDSNPGGWEKWPVNVRRRELLEKHDMEFARIHLLLDHHNISLEFARTCGFEGPCDLHGYRRLYEVPAVTVATLVERVRRGTGMDHVRVAAPHGTTHEVRRILCVGGAFMNCESQIIRFRDLGVEAIIVGEAHDLTLRLCHECGITLIETSHELSENPGLRVFAEELQQTYPGLIVHFYENPRLWVSL